MRTKAAMLGSAALLLAVAPPAAAVTGGFGVAKALRPGAAPTILVIPQLGTKDKRDSCESSGVKVPGTAKASTTGQSFDRRFAPVACEQPTIPNIRAADALKHATQHALTVLG
jgi:hypothetical protein